MLVTKVESSCIRGISWSRRGLVVSFVGGRTYRYLGVEREVYNTFLMTESKGQYYNVAIKGQYEAKRIRPLVVLAIGGKNA